MIQDLKIIFVHLMQPADQWQTCTFPLSALRRIFLGVIMKGVSLMNLNATNVARSRSDLMLCRDPFENLTENHIYFVRGVDGDHCGATKLQKPRL